MDSTYYNDYYLDLNHKEDEGEIDFLKYPSRLFYDYNIPKKMIKQCFEELKGEI